MKTLPPDLVRKRERARLPMSQVNLEALIADIKMCRVCVEAPVRRALGHEPRPIIQAHRDAKIAICSQAPGLRAHTSGIPFSDASGDRLRSWMGVTPDQFYNPTKIAIVPMGFCFPGYSATKSDLPPRPECAPLWRAKVMAHLPNLELVLLVGSYAMRWHLPSQANRSMTERVASWNENVAATRPALWPLPHPSWRNSSWLKTHPWFEGNVVPSLQTKIRTMLT